MWFQFCYQVSTSGLIVSKYPVELHKMSGERFNKKQAREIRDFIDTQRTFENVRMASGNCRKNPISESCFWTAVTWSWISKRIVFGRLFAGDAARTNLKLTRIFMGQVGLHCVLPISTYFPIDRRVDRWPFRHSDEINVVHRFEPSDGRSANEHVQTTCTHTSSTRGILLVHSRQRFTDVHRHFTRSGLNVESSVNGGFRLTHLGTPFWNERGNTTLGPSREPDRKRV